MAYWALYIGGRLVSGGIDESNSDATGTLVELANAGNVFLIALGFLLVWFVRARVARAEVESRPMSRGGLVLAPEEGVIDARIPELSGARLRESMRRSTTSDATVQHCLGLGVH